MDSFKLSLIWWLFKHAEWMVYANVNVALSVCSLFMLCDWLSKARGIVSASGVEKPYNQKELSRWPNTIRAALHTNISYYWCLKHFSFVQKGYIYTKPTLLLYKGKKDNYTSLLVLPTQIFMVMQHSSRHNHLQNYWNSYLQIHRNYLSWRSSKEMSLRLSQWFCWADKLSYLKFMSFHRWFQQ